MQRVIKRIFNQLSGVDGLTCEWPCLPYASPRQTKETRGARLFFFLVFIHVPTQMCYISGDLYSKPAFSPWLPPSPSCPFVTSAHMGPGGKGLFSKTHTRNFTPNQPMAAIQNKRGFLNSCCKHYLFMYYICFWHSVPFVGATIFFFFFFFSL